jgi:hypothetical protein
VPAGPPFFQRLDLDRMSKKTGAQFEIAVDGKPRSYRGDATTAREGAIFLKTKNPNAEIVVRDLETGETFTVKHPLQK